MIARIGQRRLHWPFTDSTNNRAAELATGPEAHGTIITADLQTQGRGQHGRTWESARRVNVLLSALLYPPPHLLQATVLTSLAAVAVAECVQDLAGCEPRIKWPNDVLVGEQKVCGILIERGHRASNDYAVVGIGLNVNTARDDFDRLGLTSATSLSLIANRYFAVDNVIDSLIDHLDRTYQRAHDDRQALESRWAELTRAHGKPATLELMDNHEVTGRIDQLSFDGVLMETTSGLRLFPPESIRHVRLNGMPL